jgi:hypothetical protein
MRFAASTSFPTNFCSRSLNPARLKGISIGLNFASRASISGATSSGAAMLASAFAFVAKPILPCARILKSNGEIKMNNASGSKGLIR